MLKNKKVFLVFSLLLISSSCFATNKKYDVVAIGKAMIDVVSFVSEEQLIQIMPKGFNKADTTKINNETVESIFLKSKDYQIIPGGSEANVIVNIASLGGKTAFNTIAANDKYGALFKDSLTMAKVDYLSKMNSDPNKKTALCFAFITPDKDRTFAVSSSITDEIDESYINYDSIKESKLFYTDASNLDGGGVKSEIINKAFEIAKVNATIIAFNLNNNHYVEAHREEIISLLDQVNIFVGSEAEAKNLFKVKATNEVINKALKHVDIVVITQGKKGAIIASKEGKFNVPTVVLNSLKIKDLNGAGDGFIAGFLYGYTHGFTLKESGKIAAKTAAEIIYNVGARPNYSLAKAVLSNSQESLISLAD